MAKDKDELKENEQVEEARDRFFVDIKPDLDHYLPGEEKSRVIRDTYDRFTKMRDARVEIEQEWKDADDAYYAAVPELDEDDDRTNLNVDPSFAIVETLNQETIERNARPFYKPLCEDESKALYNLMNDVAKSSYEQGNFDREWALTKKERDIRGTGVLMEIFRDERRIVKDFELKKNPDTGLMEESYKEREIVDWDDVYAMWRPIHEFYFDPSILHIEQAKDMFWREVIHINEFRRRYGKRRGFEDVDYVQVGNREMGSDALFQVPKDNFGVDDVEVLHYYNISTDKYIVVANGVLVRDKPIPYRHKKLPIAVFYCYKPHNRFYGMGIPVVIKQEAAEINTNRRLRLDYVKRAIQKMFFVDDAADIDEFDLTPRPHGLIPVNTQGKPITQMIAPLEYSDVKMSSYKDEELLFDDVRRRTGIDDRIQGLDKGGTATEAAILKEAAQKRINAISLFSEMDGLKRLGLIRWDNILFFYSVPRIQNTIDPMGQWKPKASSREIAVNGHEYLVDEDGNLKMIENDGVSMLKLTKKVMKMLPTDVNVVIDVQAGTQLSKPLKQAKMTEMFDRLALPTVSGPGGVDMRKLVKLYVEGNDFKADQIMTDEAANDIDWRELADLEFQAMLDGITIPPTPEAPEEHVIHEMTLSESMRFNEAPPEAQQLITQHIAGEDAALRGQASNMSVSQGGAVAGTSAGLARPTGNPIDMAPNNVPQG